jgi:hypothetical protein
MTTANDLIARALRLLTVKAPGEAVPADQAADGLESLNDLLESWSNEPLLTFYEKDDVLPLTGATSYTIGPGGDLDTTRPLKIVHGFIRQGGDTDYPLSIVDGLHWTRITFKDTSGRPEMIYYEPEFPLGVLNVYPVGDTSYELHFASWKQLPTFSSGSDSVSLPPGYERAIAYNLAVELAPEYEREPSQAVVDRAERAKTNIKRTNTVPYRMAADDGILSSSGTRYSIYGDTF